jgi:hypothetical protein
LGLDGLDADVCVDRAIDRLRDRLEKSPPAHPLAWLTRVVQNAVKKRLQRPFPVRTSQATVDAAACELPTTADLAHQRVEWLRDLAAAEASVLTKRQHGALRALLASPSIRAAASSAGLQKRDLARVMQGIVRRLQHEILLGRGPPPPL